MEKINELTNSGLYISGDTATLILIISLVVLVALVSWQLFRIADKIDGDLD